MSDHFGLVLSAADVAYFNPWAGTLALILLCGVLVVLRPARVARREILTAAVMYALSMAGLGVAAGLAVRGWTNLAFYLRGLSAFAAGLCLIFLTGTAVFNVILPRVGVARPRIYQDVAVASGALLWGFIWLRANQVDLTSLIATSAILTAVIGLSLQDTLGNILGGVVVQFDQSIQVGDWVKVDDVAGRVVEIRWRHTSIETRNWETVVMPNSALVKHKIVVLGKRQGQPRQWRRWVWFTVDYRFSPTHVIAVVNEAIRAAQISDVAESPAPNCVLMDFAESYGKYALRYWLTDLAPDDTVDSQVRGHLYFALKRANIPLSIPAQALFVTKETAKRSAMKAGRDVIRHAGALSRVEIFRNLKPKELHALAKRLVPAPFARGDIMARQGTESHWLYLIIDGQADVIVENERGRSKVAGLGPGSIFGETGLMTGEPRTATVIARTEVECYRLHKSSVQKILKGRPALVEDISNSLARQRTELEAAIENLDGDARAYRLSRSRRDIVGKIRSFFTLDEQVA
jgi:small-conductance mechanosensitive channel/CRP-like cAMP-binding protein